MNVKILNLTILAIFIFSLASTIFAKDKEANSEIFEKLPTLSIAVRINNIQRFGTQFDNMLSSIAPGWTLPGVSIRPITSYLHIPDFSSLKDDSFLECLVFKSNKNRKYFSITAVSVDDPSLFLRQVESRSTIMNNSIGGSITHFRELHAHGGDFYVAVVHDNLILFGSDKETMLFAYAFYSKLRAGALNKNQSDLDVYLHCKRILINYASLIDKTLARVEEDIANDLSVGDNQKNKQSFKRITEESLSEIRHLVNQLVKLKLSLTFNNSKVEIASNIEIEDGPLAQVIKDTTPSEPKLIKYLPTSTVMMAWKKVSITGFDLVSTRIASIMALVLEGAVDSETKDNIESIKKQIILMKPSEVVSAPIASPIDPTNRELTIHGGIKADKVAIVMLDNPSAFSLFIEKISEILGPRSSFVEQLERNGVTVVFTHDNQSDAFAGGELHRFDVDFSIKRDDSVSKDSFKGYKGKYFMALNGNLMLVATGPNSENSIQMLVDSTRGGRSFSKSLLGKNTFNLIDRKKISSAFMINPLSYIKTAAMAYAKYGQAYSVAGKPHKSVIYAKKYRNIKDVALPLVLFFGYSQGNSDNLSLIPNINSKLVVPYPAIRAIIKAVLEPDT